VDVDATPRATVRYPTEKAEAGPSSGSSRPPLPSTILPFSKEDNAADDAVDPVLVERLAGEIARRMRDEKLVGSSSCNNFWDRHHEESPPPAYGH
jgi:distribution and morphology protein 34